MQIFSLPSLLGPCASDLEHCFFVLLPFVLTSFVMQQACWFGKTSLSLSCKLFSGQSTLEKGLQKMKWFGPLTMYIYIHA